MKFYYVTSYKKRKTWNNQVFVLLHKIAQIKKRNTIIIIIYNKKKDKNN